MVMVNRTHLAVAVGWYTSELVPSARGSSSGCVVSPFLYLL